MYYYLYPYFIFDTFTLTFINYFMKIFLCIDHLYNFVSLWITENMWTIHLLVRFVKMAISTFRYYLYVYIYLCTGDFKILI